MLLSYHNLVDVVEAGVIEGADPANINGTSIDIRLGDTALVEVMPTPVCPCCGKEQPGMRNRYKHNPGAIPWRDPIYCCYCREGMVVGDFFASVDFSKKEPLKMREVSLAEGFVLMPGEVCLAHTAEKFHLPLTITAEFVLKSSQARVFLEHLHAGFCDPGWNNSVLTLEYANMTQYHPLRLVAGEKCGQIKFYKHDAVPHDESYAVRGRYNGAATVEASKGVR
jgi:deoxycytidine triphosphate deaminase